MTNLAYTAPQKQNEKLTYVDFSLHAYQKNSDRRARLLARQHRYGLLLLIVCAVSLCLCASQGLGADAGAVVLLAPLGAFLLVTRRVVLYPRR